MGKLDPNYFPSSQSNQEYNLHCWCSFNFDRFVFGYKRVLCLLYDYVGLHMPINWNILSTDFCQHIDTVYLTFWPLTIDIGSGLVYNIVPPLNHCRFKILMHPDIRKCHPATAVFVLFDKVFYFHCPHTSGRQNTRCPEILSKMKISEEKLIKFSFIPCPSKNTFYIWSQGRSVYFCWVFAPCLLCVCNEDTCKDTYQILGGWVGAVTILMWQEKIDWQRRLVRDTIYPGDEERRGEQTNIGKKRPLMMHYGAW